MTTPRYQLVKPHANALKMDFLGVVGWTFDAQSVQIALNSIDENEEVIINMHTPGGDAGEGIAIKNMLLSHRGHVTVNILSYSLSAASIIAMGANTVNMAPDAGFMIHRAWSCFCGNGEEMISQGQSLVKHDEMILQSYKARGEKLNLNDSELNDAIQKETWYTASDAIEAGFVDAILEPQGIEAVEELELNTDELEQLVLPTSTPETVLAQLGVKRQPSGYLTMTKPTTGLANAKGAAAQTAAPVETGITQEQYDQGVAQAHNDMHERYAALMPHAEARGMDWVKAQAAKTHLSVDDILDIAGDAPQASAEQPEDDTEPKVVSLTPEDFQKQIQDASAAAVRAALAETSDTGGVGSGSSEGGQPTNESINDQIKRAQALAHQDNIRNGTAQA